MNEGNERLLNELLGEADRLLDDAFLRPFVGSPEAERYACLARTEAGKAFLFAAEKISGEFGGEMRHRAEIHRLRERISRAGLFTRGMD